MVDSINNDFRLSNSNMGNSEIRAKGGSVDANAFTEKFDATDALNLQGKGKKLEKKLESAKELKDMHDGKPPVQMDPIKILRDSKS